MSSLMDRHNYLDKNIPFLISNEIIEYDMKSAGFNLIKKFKLCTQSEIDYLEKLDNKKRHIKIGLMIRKDKSLGKALNEKFKEMRNEFYNANRLTNDNILSIKKDAIYVMRRCNVLEYDNIEFVEKNHYTSYFNMGKLELYVGMDKIDVKGIADNKVIKHYPYMLDYLFIIFKMMETSQHKIIVKNVVDFANYYKQLELDVGYYRELNEISLFRTSYRLSNKFSLYSDDVGNANMIVPNYNYVNFIIPLINLLL